MGNPTSRTQKWYSQQIDALRTALHEKQIDLDLLESYLEEGPAADDLDRPPAEAIERDLVAVLEECEVSAAKLAEAVKAWSRIAWRELGIEP